MACTADAAEDTATAAAAAEAALASVVARYGDAIDGTRSDAELKTCCIAVGKASLRLREARGHAGLCEDENE